MRHVRIWPISFAILHVCCGGSSNAGAGGAQSAGGAGSDQNGEVGTGAVGDGGGAGKGAPTGGTATDGGSDTAGAGNECTANADCLDSPAAHQLDNVRCTARDIYCLRGNCYAGCLNSCSVVRTDTDPCPAPKLCVPKLNGNAFYCSITPVSCTTASDCPPAFPPTSDEPAAWQCVDGTCQYPGFDYATH